ncbi:hypothetical protein K8I61_05625 [bacterium]|nr:hypothetical protein [bacterium]
MRHAGRRVQGTGCRRGDLRAGSAYEPVGCAAASFDTGTLAILYLQWDENLDFVLTTESDITTGGPYDGEGTHPEIPLFVAFNVTPDDYVITLQADGGAVEESIPFLPPGGAVVQDFVFMAPDFTSNPTGTWCTE